MLRLVDDLLPLCHAVAEGRGLPPSVTWRDEAAVCVVLASGGYPGEYPTGLPIEGIERAEARPGVTVFHAGTALRGGRLTTAGGRVLGVTALGDDIPAAVARAYAAAADITFDGVHYRRDIGHRALRRLSSPRRVRRGPVSGPARLAVDASRPAASALETAARLLRAASPRRVSRPRPSTASAPTRSTRRRWPGCFTRRADRRTSPCSCWSTRWRWWTGSRAMCRQLARRLMARYWPGALTLVLRAHADLPDALTAGTGTIGVRLPGHPVARALGQRARRARDGAEREPARRRRARGRPMR